jgi:hypothetical protein
VRLYWKFFLLIFLLLVLEAVPAAWAGSVKCPRYTVVVEGITSPLPVPEISYRERLEMHKVTDSPGYDGRWQIDRFEQENIYSHPTTIPFGPLHTNQRIELGLGQWLQCQSSATGNSVLSVCTEGNAFLDVSRGRIGSAKSGRWIGKFSGKEVTIRFSPESVIEPDLKGEVQELKAGQINLVITAPVAKQKIAYSADSPGVLELDLKAQVTPAENQNEIQWEIPEIEGSQKKVEPASEQGPSIHVTYRGLPSQNQAFGKKTIRATVKSGACQAEDEREIQVFFPRDAKNHPGGETPNWFYYWSQTKARVGPAKFGGLIKGCSGGSGRDGTVGYYRNEAFDDFYYICDLKRLGADFRFQTVKWSGNLPDNVSVTGIDTFAAASRHENAHLRHFKDWWAAHRTSDKFKDTNRNGILDSVEEQKDKDGDLVPDLLEPGFGLDPTKKSTFGVADDDEEILTWKAEGEWSIGGADLEDWAKPGKQWK